MCMLMGSMNEMSSTMMYAMAAFFGVGLVFGLVLLVGTFYLIWRLVRAFEKRIET
jgi:uncharacterized membrane protein YciS (DUF1049 family)